METLAASNLRRQPIQFVFWKRGADLIDTQYKCMNSSSKRPACGSPSWFPPLQDTVYRVQVTGILVTGFRCQVTGFPCPPDARFFLSPVTCDLFFLFPVPCYLPVTFLFCPFPAACRAPPPAPAGTTISGYRIQVSGYRFLAPLIRGSACYLLPVTFSLLPAPCTL